MDDQPLRVFTAILDRPAHPELPALAEPDRALVLEALAQAIDWRRQVVVHREHAVRAASRPFRRAAWP
jgi:hypothetical protein